MATNKLLIINADDFGIHEDVNAGIIDGHQSGLVTSTSLLMNMPASDHAIQLMPDYPTLEVGLHLNITSQYCVAPICLVDLLVDNEGRFRFSQLPIARAMHWLRTAIAQTPALVAQIAAEFTYQVERFCAAGLQPKHINIHHYVSLLHPRLFEVYVLTAEKLGIPFRGLCYPMLQMLNIPEQEIQCMHEMALQSIMHTPHYSISNLVDPQPEAYTPLVYQRLMGEQLCKLREQSDIHSVEIVTHPARMTPFVRQHDMYARVRELETALVKSPAFRRSVQKFGYRLGGYAALCESAQFQKEL